MIFLAVAATAAAFLVWDWVRTSRVKRALANGADVDRKHIIDPAAAGAASEANSENHARAGKNYSPPAMGSGGF